MPWYVAGESKGDPPTFEVGDVLELRVRDDEGLEQGEILVGVVAHGRKHHDGEVFKGWFLGASDPYYSWWMNSSKEAPSKEDGYYHLCAVKTEECPPSRRYQGMVHSDKYRNHRGHALPTRKVEWLGNRVIREQVTMNTAKFREKVGPAKDPKDDRKREGRARLDWKDEHADEDEDEENESDDESSTDESSDVDDQMKKKLAKLRDDLLKAEKEMEERRDSKRSAGKRKGAEGDKAKKDKKKMRVTLPHAGEKKESKRGEGAKGRSPKKKKRKKKKEKKDKVTRSSGEDDPEVMRAKKQSLFTGSAKEEEDKQGSRDRGPFGEGFSVSYGEDESDSSESGFQKGSTTPAKSGQLKLIRYASKFPGRLASRMLVKMELATARGVGGPNRKESSLTPPVAMNHLLTVLIPSLGEKAGLRTIRELKTLGVILDHLAVNQFAKAADVVSQRIKALERATHEKHWGAAQFLELLPPEGTMLLDRDEEMFLAREYLLDQKLKNYDQQKKWSNERPGKGPGKEKGHKGDKGGKGAKGGGKKNQWSDEKKEEKGSG